LEALWQQDARVTDKSPILLRRDLVQNGDSPARLERGVRDRKLLRVSRGAYVTRAAWTDLSPEAQHLERICALDRTSPGETFSHHSAAAIWGLPIIGDWPIRPHVLRSSPHGTSRRVTFSVHGAVIESGEIEMVDDLKVTSKVRTALDVAACSGLEAAVVILDAVAADSTIGPARLAERTAELRPFRGVRRVDAALRHVTGLADSPLESLSLLRIAELGFPHPEQQREFRIGGVTHRVDFYWPEFEVIGEADGWSKYDDGVDAIKREKRREDELRSVVRGFARWEWRDAWLGEGLAARLVRAGLPRKRAKASRAL
jgi:hypothetical protein